MNRKQNTTVSIQESIHKRYLYQDKGTPVKEI